MPRLSVSSSAWRSALENFDAVWDAMSPINRQRLVHAVVRQVEVNKHENQVTVLLNDLGAGELGDAAQRRPGKGDTPSSTMEASP